MDKTLGWVQIHFVLSQFLKRATNLFVQLKKFQPNKWDSIRNHRDAHMITKVVFLFKCTL